MCSGGIDAQEGSTLDWTELVKRAHAILHNPPGRDDFEGVRRDLAAVIVSLEVNLMRMQFYRMAEAAGVVPTGMLMSNAKVAK